MLLVVLVVFGLILMRAIDIWFTLCLHGWICFVLAFVFCWVVLWVCCIICFCLFCTVFDPVTVGFGLIWLGCYFTLLGFAFAFVASDLLFKVVVCEFGWLVGLICVVFGFSFL